MGHEVAVLLNANARGVTPEVVRSICRCHPEHDVFVSQTSDEAESITRHILSRGYGTVVTGGGDGTVHRFLNCSIGCVGERPPQDGLGRLPTLGVLKLGTGNAISAFVGADAYLADLDRIARAEPDARRPLSLIRADGQYCYFAGFGLDADILSDYRELKDTWIGRRLKYVASIVGLSLPRSLTVRRRPPRGRVVNLGSPAYRIGPGGEPTGRPVLRGETLYEGPIFIAGASTLPYYGYRFKLYPFADRRPGSMQLRVSSADALHTLAHLPAIWRGTYRSPKTHDFFCDAVRVELDRPMPFQVGGESEGARSEVTLALSRRLIDLVDLTRPTPISPWSHTVN